MTAAWDAPSAESSSARRVTPDGERADGGAGRGGCARRAAPPLGSSPHRRRAPGSGRVAPRSRRRAPGPGRGSRPRGRGRGAPPPRRTPRPVRAVPHGSAWAPREHSRDAGRRRRHDGGCGRPGPPRWKPTHSRRRCPVDRRGRATPCSSSRVPSRARVPGSSSAPKRSLTSECVRRAHTQSHILSQPSVARTSPRTNERDQVVHVGRGHRRP